MAIKEYTSKRMQKLSDLKNACALGVKISAYICKLPVHINTKHLL